MPVDETVESFEELVNGELDEVPEQAFLNVGDVEPVLAKAKQLQDRRSVTLHVELVSPEQVLFERRGADGVARTVGGGDIAFLTGHAPFLGALAAR